MTNQSLEHVVAFNHELAALVVTGLPLDLGIDGSDETVANRLKQINPLLSARVAGGQTIEEAIHDEIEIPPGFRVVLLTFIRCDDPTMALDLVASPATARRQFTMGFGQSLVYPLLVFLLTYGAFLVLCSFTAPTIEMLYTQLDKTPHKSVAFLRACRHWMPVWGPLIPALVLVLTIWWRLRSSRWSWSWLPGANDYLETRGNAEYARRLAQLTDSGMSLDQALPLVSPLAGSHNVGDSTRSSVPSLMQWALGDSLDQQTRPSVLRFVAKTYRQKANRQARYWRFVLPTLLGLFVGGLFVLGYGLSLFLPIVQLLKDVASPVGT